MNYLHTLLLYTLRDIGPCLQDRQGDITKGAARYTLKLIWCASQR